MKNIENYITGMKKIHQSLDQVSTFIKSTHSKDADGGNFAGIYDLSEIKNFKNPVLLTATDGVGTKIHTALKYNMHFNIGIDLVAMSVNDVIAQGGVPKIFVDYYSTSKFVDDNFEEVINGICKGCEISGCSLISGETALMKGMYSEDAYDLAGFCIGFAEKDEVYRYDNIKSGDVILGVQSNGLHANGYSIVNSIDFNEQQIMENGNNIILEILKPTKIYTEVIQIQKYAKALCHITGGGFEENISRVCKDHQFSIDLEAWEKQQIFEIIKHKLNITWEEMSKIFNCGMGMCIICDVQNAEIIKNHINAIEIGTIL